MTDTTDYGSASYVVDIEKDTLDNPNFRTTRWTGKNIQLTLYLVITHVLSRVPKQYMEDHGYVDQGIFIKVASHMREFDTR